MKLDLPSELEQMLRNKVAAGQFASPDAVVVEALRLMDERDRLIAWQKAEIRQKISDGVASLRETGGIDGDDFLDQMIARLEGLEQQQKSA